MKRFVASLHVLVAQAAWADSVAKIGSPELVALLNRGEVLAECKHPQCELHVRLFRVPHSGECDGSPETCPKSSLYVAVSEYGDPPDEVAFQFEDRHNWQFVRWLESGPPGHLGYRAVRFEVRAQNPSPLSTRKERWWDDASFVGSVDLGSASFVPK
jgi:hypothetical protein